MLPVSQLASEQWLGARAFASQRNILQNRKEPAFPASLCSRLRCLSFQSTTSSATGKQPPTKPAPSIARPPNTKDAASSSQQPSVMHESSQGKAAGGAAVQRQVSASNDTAAAGKQDADRIQASEDATTSGREYWQVSNLCCACEEEVLLGYIPCLNVGCMDADPLLQLLLISLSQPCAADSRSNFTLCCRVILIRSPPSS